VEKKMKQEKREHWGSSFGFIVAAAGSAVGLGNIWKFPYVTGENGGAAFVLVYLVCILLIGFPIMLAELTIGRKAQKSPIGAFRDLMPKNCLIAHILGTIIGLSGIGLLIFKHWGWGILAIAIAIAVFKLSWGIVGYISVFAAFVILSFYSVIGGWTIGYLVETIRGLVNFETTEQAASFFGNHIANIPWSVSYHIFFMSVCVALVMIGLKKGIEKCSKILMPLLIVILIALIIRGVSLPGAQAGINFYLLPDFSKITTTSVLVALGHAFFSLSLAMGIIITYGSYVDENQDLFKASLSIVAFDTIIALMAGLAMFPAIFALGGEPAAGPGLIFQVIPTVFHQMPLGSIWIFVFFALILIAALTSAISLLEVVTSAIMDELKFSRHKATLISGVAIAIVGLLSAISVANWDNIKWLQCFFEKGFNLDTPSFFDLADQLTANWLLPIGGIFISIFVGWIWGTKNAIKEIQKGAPEFDNMNILTIFGHSQNQGGFPSFAAIWGFSLRFISPIAVIIVFLYSIGWLKIGN
jgi:NSS family neurotransmitter:Na+ symporter